MWFVRKILILISLFFILHTAAFTSQKLSGIDYWRDTGFFDNIEGTFFVFTFVGFFPILIIFPLARVFYNVFPVLQERKILDDIAFAVLFIVLMVAMFIIYGTLGMLAA